MTTADDRDGQSGPGFVFGVGCERGTPPAEMIALVESGLRDAGLASADIRLIASLDTRAKEPAMIALADHFSVPFHVFDAARLERETPRLANPSSIVFSHTGCHGVAEAAALAGAGAAGRLVVAKRKSAHATVAIAESVQGFDATASEPESAASRIDSARAVPELAL